MIAQSPIEQPTPLDAVKKLYEEACEKATKRPNGVAITFWDGRCTAFSEVLSILAAAQQCALCHQKGEHIFSDCNCYEQATAASGALEGDKSTLPTKNIIENHIKNTAQAVSGDASARKDEVAIGVGSPTPPAAPPSSPEVRRSETTATYIKSGESIKVAAEPITISLERQPVSLKKCIEAAEEADSADDQGFAEVPIDRITKAVLDAAGVKYVD